MNSCTRAACRDVKTKQWLFTSQANHTCHCTAELFYSSSVPYHSFILALKRKITFYSLLFKSEEKDKQPKTRLNYCQLQLVRYVSGLIILA